MKKRLISILCAAAMATSLFAGATVVSAAENKEAKDITIGVSFGQNVHPFFVAMQKGIEQGSILYHRSFSHWTMRSRALMRY